MSSVDLALRYLINAVAWHLACAWIQTFQSSYPIADAFELAGTAEEQLFKSLGISWRSLSAAASRASAEEAPDCQPAPFPPSIFSIISRATPKPIACPQSPATPH